MVLLLGVNGNLQTFWKDFSIFVVVFFIKSVYTYCITILQGREKKILVEKGIYFVLIFLGCSIFLIFWTYTFELGFLYLCMDARPPSSAEGRIVSAVAHLAYARTQNSGTGILGLLIIRSLRPLGCGLLFMHRPALGSLLLKRYAGRAASRGRNLPCSIA